MDKESKIKMRRFKEQEKELLDILNEWDPIQGSPHDEYDCLCHSVLSLLYSKQGEFRLNQFIQDELNGHFGFGNAGEDVEKISKKINN